MSIINQFGPWVTLITFISLIVFFAIFYIVRYIQVKKESKSLDSKNYSVYKDSIHKKKIKTSFVK